MLAGTALQSSYCAAVDVLRKAANAGSKKLGMQPVTADVPLQSALDQSRCVSVSFSWDALVCKASGCLPYHQAGLKLLVKDTVLVQVWLGEGKSHARNTTVAEAAVGVQRGH